MLDRPGHRADSGPHYDGGPGPNARSPRPNPGARRSSRGGQGPPAGPQRWWGSRPGRLGIAFVIGGALAGLLVTVMTGTEPGVLLGIFLLAGTAAGALAVHPRAAYLIIPVPALAYLAAAIAAGLIHDRAADTSHTALAISAAQWIAGGFFTMTGATLLAIVVAAGRWAAARVGAGPPASPPDPAVTRLR